MRRSLRLALRLILTTGLLAGAARAQTLAGDLDGDGSVGPADRSLLSGFLLSRTGDPDFDPAADLDADGIVGPGDLALLDANLGIGGGEPDATPPALFLTLNDIPDAMNDRLVVPPDGFRITLAIDGRGGSPIDTSSLVVTSSGDIGEEPAGTNLAPRFAVSPVRAWWEIPSGSDLARTTHRLEVRLRDAAGNEARASLAFAVRDFPAGAPLGNPQTLFVDFDQNRNLGPRIDFLESLHEFGLSSPSLATSGDEGDLRDVIVAMILERLNQSYGRKADGTPGPDAVHVAFTSTRPAVPHSRICVGGESPQGGAYLGAATLDRNNLLETGDECATAVLGVFPHAIDDLWGDDPAFQSAFAAVDPDLGGTPFGEHVLDAALLAPDFDLPSAGPAQIARLFAVFDAIDAFVRVVSVATAHEVGHMLGLVAHGPAPGGLWGGSRGAATDHNVAASGGAPSGNFVMNAGSEFRFDEITGRGAEGPPVFRPLNWAYLRDRVVLDGDVTALLPAPVLTSLAPARLIFSSDRPESQRVTLSGDHFVDPAAIELVDPVDPLPLPGFGVSVVDANTLTVLVHRSFVAPGLYDVRLINGDGQIGVLEGALRVVFQ